MLEFNPGIISGFIPKTERRMKWFLNFSPSLKSCAVSGIAVALFALLAVKPEKWSTASCRKRRTNRRQNLTRRRLGRPVCCITYKKEERRNQSERDKEKEEKEEGKRSSKLEGKEEEEEEEEKCTINTYRPLLFRKTNCFSNRLPLV